MTDVHAIGLKLAQGLALVSHPFYWDMDDQTRAFTKRFNEKHKKGPPTMVQAGVYSSLIHYFKALEALGGNPHDGRAVVAKMKEMPTDDPLFGKGSVRADGRKIHPAYLFEVKKPAEFEVSVGLLQPRRHHPGGGSLHPAREERLPDAEEVPHPALATSGRFRRRCDGSRPRTIFPLSFRPPSIASPMWRQASSNCPSSP